MLITDEPITPEAFSSATGWELRPEGACRGDLCVPLRPGTVANGTVDPNGMAEALGMAIVRHNETLAALGPASFNGRALAGVEAPELVLPDFYGRDFRLSSLRGQKVVLVAWAPY